MSAGVSFFIFFLLSVTYSLLTDFFVVVLIRWLLLKCFWCCTTFFSLSSWLVSLSPSFSSLSLGGWVRAHEEVSFLFKTFLEKETRLHSLSIEKEQKTKKQKRKSVVVVVVPEWCYTTKQHQNVDLREQNSTLLHSTIN